MTAIESQQRLLLARLARLTYMRHAYRQDLNGEGVRLLDRCIQATLNDCDDFGIGDEARLRLAGGVA